MSGDNQVSWSCREVIGVGVPNVKPVVVMPITPEMRQQLEADAAERNMTLDEYLDWLFEEGPHAREQERPTQQRGEPR